LKEKKSTWDFLSTFRPPEDLSIETGNIWRKENLSEAAPDYEHVSKLFMTTYNGGAGANLGAPFAKKSSRVRPNPIPPPFFGAPVNPLPAGFGIANPVGGPVGAGGQPKIQKIEKVYNCIIYEKFINEFKRMLRKYPQKNLHDIMKHLFHGTR
jgi:hypothetical protein